MGRVYEALKRAAEKSAAEQKQNGRPGAADAPDSAAVMNAAGDEAAPSNGQAAGNGNGNGHGAAAPEFLYHFQAPDPSAAPHRSASNEHTVTRGGSALPAGAASRAAGATLGAAGSTRTPDFFTLEISAARVEPHLVAVTQPRSGQAERYRSLRTRLLHAGERKRMHAFVVTSAGIMEGKTLTATNLAWLLAQTDGVKALLIDGDLRNPCCADYLGIDAPTGLSEVLAGEAALEDVILRLEPAGLHLLPGGARRDDVAELLSGPKFSAVLAEARRMFDYVIIDAPPLAVFTDATLLIGRADAALIVARANKTRAAQLEKVLAPVPRERLLGVVLNGSDEQMNEQNYYYRRYSSRRAMADGERAEVRAEETKVRED